MAAAVPLFNIAPDLAVSRLCLGFEFFLCLNLSCTFFHFVISIAKMQELKKLKFVFAVYFTFTQAP